MYLKKIDEPSFTTFASTHPLRSYHQSASYAQYMQNKGFKHHYIALVDDNNRILAASLILYKKLGFFSKYGYAPKGFLIDYTNQQLVKTFTQELKKFYFARNFAFMKINPEISIGEIIPEDNKVIYNQNSLIIDTLQNNGYHRVGPNYKFETLQPRFNAIIPLKYFNFTLLNKPFKTKIRKSTRLGLQFTKVSKEELPIIYEFVKNKKNRTFDDYVNYYNAFSKNMDFFLVSVDFEKYLILLREEYEKELKRNEQLVEKMLAKNTTNILNQKLNSDYLLESLKNDIIIATKSLAQNKTKYVAGAITIRYQNRVSIITSGYDLNYKRLYSNHFLHYELLKYYQKDFDFLDLNGITGDFSKENPYYGLNKFKLGMHPKCFEYIGEFDYIINPGLYKGLLNNGLLQKEFTKKQKK